jgi:hypothetical protein
MVHKDFNRLDRVNSACLCLQDGSDKGKTILNKYLKMRDTILSELSI